MLGLLVRPGNCVAVPPRRDLQVRAGDAKACHLHLISKGEMCTSGSVDLEHHYFTPVVMFPPLLPFAPRSSPVRWETCSRKSLVIGADALSRWVDWEDRNSCILFGDGAGAMVLEAAEAEDSAGLLGETETR